MNLPHKEAPSSSPLPTFYIYIKWQLRGVGLHLRNDRHACVIRCCRYCLPSWSACTISIGTTALRRTNKRVLTNLFTPPRLSKGSYTYICTALLHSSGAKVPENSCHLANAFMETLFAALIRRYAAWLVVVRKCCCYTVCYCKLLIHSSSHHHRLLRRSRCVCAVIISNTLTISRCVTETIAQM